MAETKVLKCSCVHKYQDRRYGAGMRAHNQTKGGKSGSAGWRCTICKTVRDG